MASKETLKAKRHQLYCSIADALNHTGAESSDILGRLQAVLEAEACLSVIDDDSEGSVQHTSHGYRQQHSITSSQQQTAGTTQTAHHHVPALSASKLMARSSSKGQAASALQQLKQELAQQVHQSLQQTQQAQQNTPRKGKFLSCSSLLADLRAAQRTNADLEAQLQAAQAATARQQKQQEQEVRKYRKAAEQATRLAEITNSRLMEAEQQIAAHTQDVAGQMQQLAEQATCTIKLGEELRQVKKHMAQLHLSVVQPLLRWQHDQKQQEEDSAVEGSSSSRGSKRHSHQRWDTSQAVTADAIAAAAAAVEDLLLQQADQEQILQAKLRSSQASVLRGSCHKQAQLQEKVQQLQSELQQLREELEDSQLRTTAAQQRADTLQQQLYASSLQLRQSQQQHSQALATAAQQAAEDTQQQLQGQQQQFQMLQQETNRLTSELACAQGEAAAAQRQIARLQDEQQQVAAEYEQRLQQLQQTLDVRLSQESAAAVAASAEHELRLQHMQAMTAARQEAQQASEAAATAWQQQQAALEKQHLQALLRLRQAHEQDRQQWQKERDELVQQLTAEFTASGMQAHIQAKEQVQDLQHQLRQLQQKHDVLLQRHAAGTLHDNQPTLCLTTAAYGTSGQQLRASMPQGNTTSSSGSMRASASAGEPAAFAVQFSRALQIADGEAARRAAAAEQDAAELWQQLTQQDLELGHLHRALEELRNACAAANGAAAEAEASASASSNALQEQLVQNQQLQRQLDRAGELHQAELRALRQSMSEQVKVIQGDARAELEAAQTRLQLVRLKQQRVVSSMLGTQAT